MSDSPTELAAHQDAAHARMVESVRNDPRFTDLVGKKEELILLEAERLKRLHQGRDDGLAQLEADRESTHRDVFDVASDPMTTVSYRDAKDRVSKARRPSDLVVFINEAADDGDPILALAALRQSFVHNWAEPLRVYVERFPEKARAVSAYVAALQASQASKTNRARASVLEAMGRPRELAGKSSRQILDEAARLKAAR